MSCRGEGVADRQRWPRHRRAGAKDHQVDLGPLAEYLLKPRRFEIRHSGHRPGEDPARQQQNRTAVRHPREAETAAAIGLDGRPPGIEGGQGLAATAALASALAFSRTVPSSSRTGVAMKKVE